MTKRLLTISIVSCLGLAMLAVVFTQPSARAQSADLVLCDRLAADPADPDKPADVTGVDHVTPSDVATAIKFCKIAAGSARRAAYQLGRAYAAGQQLPAAVAAFRKAADKGSTAAMIQLGVMYAAGTGVAKDEGEARKYFERAAPAISLRCRAMPGTRPIPPRLARCWRKRPTPIRPRRSFSSA
jgi:uncharacterized protein